MNKGKAVKGIKAHKEFANNSLSHIDLSNVNLNNLFESYNNKTSCYIQEWDIHSGDYLIDNITFKIFEFDNIFLNIDFSFFDIEKRLSVKSSFNFCDIKDASILFYPLISYFYDKRAKSHILDLSNLLNISNNNLIFISIDKNYQAFFKIASNTSCYSYRFYKFYYSPNYNDPFKTYKFELLSNDKASFIKNSNMKLLTIDDCYSCENDYYNCISNMNITELLKSFACQSVE